MRNRRKLNSEPTRCAPLLALCGVEGVEGYADTRQAPEAARLRQIARNRVMTASVDGWEARGSYPSLSVDVLDLYGKTPKDTLAFTIPKAPDKLSRA